MSDPHEIGARRFSVLAATAAGIRFFSRLPLPALGACDNPAQPPPFGHTARLLPLASLVIALPAALVMSVLVFFAIPDLLAASISVLVGILVCGALHEDGLADVADGFGGGRDRARKLEIMRDSRVGTHGVLALCGTVLIRVACLAALSRINPVLAVACLAVVPVLARSSALLPWTMLRPARADGASASIQAPSRGDVAIGVVGAGAVAFLILGPLAGGLALIGALSASAAVTLLARGQIGGHTGDVIGAAEQSSELLAYTALASVASRLI